MMSNLGHGRSHLKKFLATLALTAVIATPVFAQSFDPEAGTGNLLPSYFAADGGLHAGIAGPPQSYKTADRQGRLPVYGMATTSSRGIHRRWASRAR
jgi:hypothetical protein